MMPRGTGCHADERTVLMKTCVLVDIQEQITCTCLVSISSGLARPYKSAGVSGFKADFDYYKVVEMFGQKNAGLQEDLFDFIIKILLPFPKGFSCMLNCI